MKLLEAAECLKNIADGKYRSLEYVVTYKGIHGGNCENKEVVCSVYVYGYGYFTGETWEDALLKCEYAVHPEQKPMVEVEDI